MSDLDGNVDYSTYTYPELLQALDSIDARQYPKNYANLERAIEEIGPGMRAAHEGDPIGAPEPAIVEVDRRSSWQDAPEPDPDAEYIKHMLTALAVAGASAYLLWVDDIVLKFGNPITITIGSGLSETLAKAAFVFAVTVPMSFVIKLLDHNDDKKKYRLYALFAESVATGLLIVACIMGMS